jgi:hypothetical protein
MWRLSRDCTEASPMSDRVAEIATRIEIGEDG